VSNPEPAWNEGSLFLRILYNILFYIVFGLVEIVLLFLLLVQGVLVIARGRPSERLQQFARNLGAYTSQIVRYVGCQSARKPWPLGYWPDTGHKHDH